MDLNKKTVKEYISHPKTAVWYTLYTRSAKWRAICKRIKHRAHDRCEICTRIDGLFQVHHRTYERVTKEADEDLLYVCKPCHKILHTNKIIPYAERIYDERPPKDWKIL